MLEVGQTVYLVAVQRTRGITEATIEKIGRKYLTVKLHSWRVQFDKETLIQKNTGYGPGADYTLYLTLEDYRTQVERNALVDTISREFRRYRWEEKLSDRQLHEIAVVLGVEKEAAELAASRELTLS